MKNRIRAGPRFITAGVLAAALAVTAQTAAAQSVFFSGFTRGCFGVACTPAGSAVLQGLSFTGGTFSGTTVNGQLAVGSAGNNFGSFALAPRPWHNYTGQTFTLLVDLLNPSAFQGVFTASLVGNIRRGLTDLFIDFDNNPVVWANGAYSARVNDVSIQSETSSIVSGNLTATPEPISMILLGTGLAGVGLARRRRRKVEQADLI